MFETVYLFLCHLRLVYIPLSMISTLDRATYFSMLCYKDVSPLLKVLCNHNMLEMQSMMDAICTDG